MGVFKSKFNVLVLIFFIASLLFVIYTLIFNKPEVTSNNGKFNYTQEEISIYSTDEYVVRDYNEFYSIENIIKQIISALSEEKYKEVYSVLSSEIAGDISKEQYVSVFSEFYVSNFSDIKNEQGEVTEKYKNSKNLVSAYKLENNVYIAEVKNNHGSITKIAVRLKNNSSYEIVYFEV